MKICPQCQKEYADDTVFCMSCGAQLVQEQEQARPVSGGFCSRCGTPLASGVAFCPGCGNPVNGGVNPYTAAPAKPANDTFSKAVNGFSDLIKKYFKSPADAVDEIIESKNIVAGIAGAVIFAAATLIFFLCLCGKLAMITYPEPEMFFIGIVMAFITAVTSLGIPALTTFLSAKLTKKDIPVLPAFSAVWFNFIPVALLLIITSVMTLISLKLGIFLLIVTITAKAVISVTTVNKVVGTISENIAAFCASIGAAAVIKAIVISILAAIAADAIEDLFYNLLWSMW